MNCLNILWYPSSLSFMQSLCSGNDSSILAVTEGCQLSIWDLRMKENGGCVHRIYGSVGDIFYAVCSSSTSIAVGGADCTVTVYDPRRERKETPKIEWAPNVFWSGSEKVTCFLLHGKSHGEDGSSKPFMSEWEVDVVFGPKFLTDSNSFSVIKLPETAQ
ncbi:hypothetical protein HYC85_007845 [Camellia sinensis]|uniref:Uncharacterized protein n=1 Tax=Camellia sinensis TaxID=4442 RepID=A0A7J7HQR4_CAMSI|nr:hypothetical protein HYC85_007845 [Camellia sinensis]